MKSKLFFEALDTLVQERGIAKDKVLEVFERGMLNSIKKEYGTSDNIRIEFNEEKQEIKVMQDFLVVKEPTDGTEISHEDAKEKRKTIKIGDTLTVDVTTKDTFGRIAAVSAKQILTQGLKQLEREKIYDIFKEKENEMITGEIVGLNKDFVTLNLSHNLETSLPRKELLKSDEVRIGAKLKVYITKVDMTTKGPKVFVSRTDRNLVKRLIEQVVPEIMDGTVEIMGLARDAGSRSKIAVYSHDENVDPVGACLGRDSNRKKEVEEALQGERISFYRWSNDPYDLIQDALAPASIIAINPSHKDKTATVIVEDHDFTGAIGTKGQNVRLAAQSSGWKIDIKSVSDAKELGINYTPLEEQERDSDEQET